MAEVAAGIGVVSGAMDIIGGVGGAMSGSSSAQNSQRAAQYQAEAMKVQNRISKLQAQRQRELDIEQVRQAEGQLLNTAGNAAGVNTSAAQGSMGSLASQLKSNIGFGNQVQQLQDLYAEYENQSIMSGNLASEDASNAQAFGRLSGIGDSLTDFSKIDFGKVFGGGGGNAGN